VRISLGTDAHHAEQLAFMELGLAAALLAKIPAERMVSFLPKADLLAWVSRVRR
jgi:histidinol phosphatase-like PHP family hydrolase